MRFLLLLLTLVAFPAFAGPTEAQSLNWNPSTGATGYKVYCATDGRHASAVARTVPTTNMQFAGFPDGVYDCKVTAFNAREESQFSDVSVPRVECRGGKCYPLDVVSRPSPPSMCAIETVSYTVIRNASREDGARPLNRLKDPALPYSDTNKLVALSPAAYVAPGTACEVTPLVVRTSAGYWLWTTNASGVRGIALCQRQ